MARADGVNLGLAGEHLLRSIGRIGGVTPFIIRGRSTTIGTTEHEVWGQDASYVYPSGELGLTVVSDSAADAAAGTGMRTMLISGVDEAYNAVSEEVTLTGLTPTAVTTALFYRVNEIVIKTSGSGNVNAGTILVKHGTNIVNCMMPGAGISCAGIYTVPLGSSFVARELILGVGKLGNAVINVYFMRPGEGWIAMRQINLYQNSKIIKANGSLLPAGTDFRVTATGGASGTSITSEILAQLITDEAMV